MNKKNEKNHDVKEELSDSVSDTLKANKPRTAKVGAISKAQN